MLVMYLDESGDHDLVHIDPAYSVFVIGGVIVDRAYVRTVLEPTVQAFKREWFGRDDIILHTADIARARNGFERLRSDPAFRAAFLPALSELVASLDYKVVACAIHKDRHVARYREQVGDPYDVGLEVVVERFCVEIGDVADGGIIVAEKRRPDLDHRLDIAWEHLRQRGAASSDTSPAGRVDERIVGLGLKAKSVNIAGLQLADLVISPVGRHLVGHRTHDNWEIVKDKLCRDASGRIAGHGLVVLPR